MVSEARQQAPCRRGEEYVLQRDLKKARTLCEWVAEETVFDDWEGNPYEVLPEVPFESQNLQFQGVGHKCRPCTSFDYTRLGGSRAGVFSDTYFVWRVHDF